MSDKTHSDAWRAAFDDRHEFDVYPEHFMSGLRNEFCAGWHAALKNQAASQPKALTDERIAELWTEHEGFPQDFARAVIEESTK